jgi:hypothetical protein
MEYWNCWHGTLRLSNKINMPKDTALAFSEFAYIAVKHYINAPHEAVEVFKKSIAVERRRGATYQISPTFKHMSRSFHARFTARRFVATFVAFAVTELVQHINSLTADERANFINDIEQEYFDGLQQAIANTIPKNAIQISGMNTHATSHAPNPPAQQNIPPVFQPTPFQPLQQAYDFDAPILENTIAHPPKIQLQPRRKITPNL